MDNVLSYEEGQKISTDSKPERLPRALVESMDEKPSFDITGQEQSARKHDISLSQQINLSQIGEDSVTKSLREKLSMAEEKISKLQDLNSSLSRKLGSAEEEIEVGGTCLTAFTNYTLGMSLEDSKAGTCQPTSEHRTGGYRS